MEMPKLKPHEGGWVVIDRATGMGVAEIFRGYGRAITIDAELFELVPIGEYLARMRQPIRGAGGCNGTT